MVNTFWFRSFISTIKAAVTDIVVLVLAADDGIMPQTREALAHAQAANLPVVVAINKCDKPNADPQKVRIQFCSEGLALEEMGGDIQVVEISATKNIGLDKLKEALLLQAEIMDLKARIDGFAHHPDSLEEDEDAEDAFNIMRNWLNKYLVQNRNVME